MKVVGLGEIMLRLATIKGNLVCNSHNFMANYGGGEANVLISLAKFGIDTTMLTKVSDNDIGKAILAHLKSNNINTDYILKDEKRTGIYFLEIGSGSRTSKVIYDRAHSAFSNIKDGQLNIEEALSGANIFHLSGITLSLSEEIRKLIMNILKYCKENNILVSYDSNYRSKLWSIEDAKNATLEILPYVNILSAGILDAENILGMNSEYKDREEKLKSYYSGIVKNYPNIKYIFSSIRDIKSSDINYLQCMFYVQNELYKSKIYMIDDIVDRVGGGDALTAGIIYGILKEKNPEYVCEFATAASVLKHSIYGDANLVSIDDVETLMKNGIGKIER